MEKHCALVVPASIVSATKLCVAIIRSSLRDLGLPRDKYEFQMLLGVDEELRRIIITAGHKLRVYVPFGPQWYAYSTRRLKENPQIAGYVLQNIFKRQPKDAV